MEMRLKDCLKNAGEDDERAAHWMVDMKFTFTGANSGEMVGKVLGVRTSHDGLPFIEVSNQFFEGFKIKGIMWRHSPDNEDGYNATLYVVSNHPDYSSYRGTILFH